tara:strand:- start:483 stop:659 length:177 start_codon:yes stop_codon:yes gene_type:complete
MSMAKYNIQVVVNLEHDGEFDSEEEAERFGWHMSHNAERFWASVESIEVTKEEEDEDE